MFDLLTWCAECDEPPPVVVPREAGILVVVPGMGFDLEGVRLGRGGGFYDRTLAHLRQKKQVTAIGIGYAGQEMNLVPRGGTDQRLDYVLTEAGPQACG